MNLGRVLIGLVVTALGVLFLLDSLEIIDDAGRTIGAVWPLAIVAVGVSRGWTGPCCGRSL